MSKVENTRRFLDLGLRTADWSHLSKTAVAAA
jgi:hypothetical protein